MIGVQESRQLKEYRRIEEKRMLLDPNKRHEYIRREKEKKIAHKMEVAYQRKMRALG